MSVLDLDSIESLPDGQKKFFKQLNCYDYSEFCAKKLNITLFPHYHIYKDGKLKSSMDYIPRPDNIEK